MKKYNTKYGELKHISEYSLYPDDTLKECMLLEESKLNTDIGVLIPQYEYGDDRRKYVYSISFYQDGTMRRIALHDKTIIKTPVGEMSAELLTFYKSGKIKRVFPLNGRISAYWSEQDEYKLATEDTLNLLIGEIKGKIIAYSFYEDGTLKDITTWPGEKLHIETPIGAVEGRIGISLYEDGSLKSFEPRMPIKIKTPIGEIEAYDVNANGMNGDKNSLEFYANGNIKEITTCSMKISLISHDGEVFEIFEPVQEWDEDNVEISFSGLKISFKNNKIMFNDFFEYSIEEYDFVIESYERRVQSMCASCSS